jgi:hypothetical protein
MDNNNVPVDRFSYELHLIDKENNETVVIINQPGQGLLKPGYKRNEQFITAVEDNGVRVFEMDQHKIKIQIANTPPPNNILIIDSREAINLVRTILWFCLEKVYDSANLKK